MTPQIFVASVAGHLVSLKGLHAHLKHSLTRTHYTQRLWRDRPGLAGWVPSTQRYARRTALVLFLLRFSLHDDMHTSKQQSHHHRHRPYIHSRTLTHKHIHSHKHAHDILPVSFTLSTKLCICSLKVHQMNLNSVWPQMVDGLRSCSAQFNNNDAPQNRLWQRKGVLPYGDSTMLKTAIDSTCLSVYEVCMWIY